MTIETLVAVSGFVLSLLIAVISGYNSMRSKQQAKVAQLQLLAAEEAREEALREKDYSRMKTEQQQLFQSMSVMLEKQREIKQEVSEIKTLLLSRGKINGRDE